MTVVPQLDASLQGAEEWRRQLQALAAVTRTVAEAESVEASAPAITEAIRESFAAEACELWLRDDKEGVLRLADIAITGSDELRRFADESLGKTFSPGEDLPGRVWSSLEPWWVEDLAAEFSRGEAAEQAGLRAAAAFPLVIGVDFFGALCVYTSRAWTPDEAATGMMAAIGAQIGSSIRRRNMETELRRRDRELRDGAVEQKRVHETTAHLAAIVENSDAAIIGKTLDGIVTSWNKAAERIYGYTAEEMLGQSVSLLVPENRAAEWHEIMDCLRRGKRIEHYETVRRRKDGRLIDISLAVSPIPDESGRLIGASAVGHDITQWKLASSALEQSEERLQFTLQAAQIGSWDWNIQTGEVTWSKNLDAIHDRPPGNRRGTFEDMLRGVYPPDLLRVREAIDAALAGSGSFEIEYRCVRGDGSMGWLHGQGRAVFDSSGRPVRMAGISMDVTRRHVADEAARLLAEAGVILAGTLDYERTLEAIAQLLVPSLGDWCAIELLNERQEIEHVTVIHADPEKVDLALELRSKYPPRMDPAQPGFGRAIHTGKAELFPELTDEFIRHVARDDHHYEILSKLGIKSGLVVPLIARGRTLGAITLVAAESGRRYGERDVALVRDLALRCALAVDNAKLYQDAQRELAERRRVEHELREAREAAEAANQSKTEFLANVSHEIRTPMTAILGYADLLGRSLRNLDDLTNLDIIRRNGTFLLDVLNDVLDLSRIEAGKLEIEQRRFRPDDLFFEVCSLMQVRASEKRLSLLLEFDGPIPETIESDPTRLRQVAVNLVGNAIKFTESGRVRIVVRHLPGAPQLEFDVIDTGIGITAEQMSRLFHPFTQADASVARRYGGSGVGLALSKRLAEMLGGGIEAQSELGKGSTFTVTIATGRLEGIPLVQPRQPSPPEQYPDPIPTSTPRLAAGRVLVIDDQADIRFFVQHVINEAGGETVGAADGRQGIEVVERAQRSGRSIDVILMDMQMPTMNGYEATSLLRATGFNAPIIAMTAYAMQQDRDRCLQAGCSDYISKPLDIGELIDAVQRNLPSVPLAQRTSTDGSQPTIDGPPVRVLFVEDSYSVCRMMGMLLQSQGYEVRSASDGSGALQVAGEFQPDVIVLDLGLPDMTGYDVAARLKEMPELDGSVLIALSGRGEPEVRWRTREAGFHYYLMKPADIEELTSLFPKTRRSRG